VARTLIGTAGADLASRILEIESGLQKKALVYQFWVDLSLSEAAWAVQILRKCGYFFGGVVPLWNRGDALLMQKTMGEPNWDEIRVVDEKGQEILKRVRDDWNQVKNKALEQV
jgi:hypothetical protein